MALTDYGQITNKYGVILEPGDRIFDPIYKSTIREILSFDETTLYMTDGGCIGVDEIESWNAFVD